MIIREKTGTYISVDGHLQFMHTTIIFTIDQTLYVGRSPRPANGEHKFEELFYKAIIPADIFHAPLPSTMKPLNPIPANCFIKRPRLSQVDMLRDASGGVNTASVIDNFFLEAGFMPKLANNPHPNICEFLGVQVIDGKIAGICCKMYRDTLEQRLNPGGLGKTKFKYSDGSLKDRQGFLNGVRAGIKHLHSLGFVHNDICPSNIMFKDDDTPVIIDFSATRPIGQGPMEVTQTPDWFDPNNKTAQFENDLDALAELEEWLSPKTVKNWKFRFVWPAEKYYQGNDG